MKASKCHVLHLNGLQICKYEVYSVMNFTLEGALTYITSWYTVLAAILSVCMLLKLL